METMKPYWYMTRLPEPYDHDAVLKHLEMIGRVCYKSEDKITNESCIKFINNLKQRKHWAMLEHYIFTFQVSKEIFYDLLDADRYISNNYDFVSKIPYIKTSLDLTENKYIVSASATALNYLWNCKCYSYPQCRDGLVRLCLFMKDKYPELMMDPVENRAPDPLLYLYNEIRFMNREEVKALPVESRRIHDFKTIKFYTSRAITHELVRHRPCSWAQESTRYVNEENLVVIMPEFVESDTEIERVWSEAMQYAQDAYKKLIELGCKPQEAREVLPNSTKAEIIMTCNLEELHHFLDMRTGKGAHPEMRSLATSVLSRMCREEPEIFGDLQYRLEER